MRNSKKAAQEKREQVQAATGIQKRLRIKKAQEIVRIKRKFAQLDADGNGVLEGDEIRQLATWVLLSFKPGGRAALSEAEVDEAAAKLTTLTDSDCSGKIAFSAFHAYYAQVTMDITQFKRTQAQAAKDAAARKMQGSARMRNSRKAAQEKREQRDAAVLLQGSLRMRNSRKAAQEKRKQRDAAKVKKAEQDEPALSMRMHCTEDHECRSSSTALRADMAALVARRSTGSHAAAAPNAFAMWCVHPDRYDAALPACGGVLFASLPSPCMAAVDAQCRCWVAQDQASSLLVLDPRAAAPPEARVLQLAVPRPCDAPPLPTIIGPAIGTSPDGAVWFGLLESSGAMVRADPKTMARTLYDFGLPDWAKALNLIHMVFAPRAAGLPSGGGGIDAPDDSSCLEASVPAVVDASAAASYNIMYALSSDLADTSSVCAIVVLLFDETWRTVLGRRVVPLPTQGCAAHRIELCAEGMGRCTHSLVVTELSSARIFQIKTERLLGCVTKLNESVEKVALDCPLCPPETEGCEWRRYTAAATDLNA